MITAWKARLVTKIVRKRLPNGSFREATEPRRNAIAIKGQVWALYLDLAEWAVEDPGQWVAWVAPCPISEAECSNKKAWRQLPDGREPRAGRAGGVRTDRLGGAGPEDRHLGAGGLRDQSVRRDVGVLPRGVRARGGELPVRVSVPLRAVDQHLRGAGREVDVPDGAGQRVVPDPLPAAANKG
ncbi:hypothetical protein ABCR94_02825 [Streptomyces sp. 21So2-11]|uniref:hypothetical protein n=1 Tax=Streptomyces sp. 21So2-11 TaxID=3144408 RepID=UPI0032194B4E